MTKRRDKPLTLEELKDRAFGCGSETRQALLELVEEGVVEGFLRPDGEIEFGLIE